MAVRLRWAVAGPAYAGMLLGVFMLLGRPGFPVVAALIVGPLFGGAVGLILSAAQGLAGLLVRALLSRHSYAVPAFGVLGLWFDMAMINAVNTATKTMGPMFPNPVLAFAFVLASVGISCVLMALSSPGRTYA